MRVRVDSYNAFAEFLGLADRRDSQPPADADRLTPAQAQRLLHDLAGRKPGFANAAGTLRTAAVAALVADTDRSVPDLAGLSIKALHLDGAARIELADGPCPLGAQTVLILNRWLEARAAIIAELEGSDPGHLWIPVKPGRPRGRPPAGEAGPEASRRPHPARRPPQAHQPRAGYTAASRRLPQPVQPGRKPDRHGSGRSAHLGIMTSSEVWGQQAAARYDADITERFGPDVLDPAVDFLARQSTTAASGTRWPRDPSPGPPQSGAGEDDELLGRPGHRDIAVDCSFDTLAERLRVDEDDQVELEPLGQFRGQ